METGSPRQTLRQKTSQVLRQKQIGRIKLGQLFSLPEAEFRKLIKELENDPLFKELIHKWKVVSYRKFTGVRLPSSVELKEDLIFSSDTFDLESLLYRNPKTVPLLQKIGQLIGKDRFNKLLHGRASIGEIERECRLTAKETEIFKDFLNRFELEKLTSGGSISSIESIPSSSARTFKIASIEREGDELVIYPHLKEDYLVKGKYSINYERYEELYRKRNLAPEILNRTSKIFKMLNLVNRRTTTIYQIIYHIKETQSDYLYSGDMGRLRPLTRRELARRIGVHPSSITRVMADKSIGTPQRKELPLKFFFPSQKEITKSYLQDLMEEEKILLQDNRLPRPYSDVVIKGRLYRDYHIAISRRAVAKYRKELKIPASSRRRKEILLANEM
ncbi:MAG: hypothetical protein ACE5HR_03610 [bacterium]